MQKVSQIILAGEGGQGLIVAGGILAKAALIENKNVVQSQSYGTASRGGYSQAEVMISDGPIYYPHCDKPQVVLTLTQQAYMRYFDSVPKDCLIIYDKDLVQPKGRDNQVGYKLRDTALELGRLQVMNILSLGYILKHYPVLKPENLEEGIRQQFPEKIHALNIRAFRIGLDIESL